MHLTDAGAAQDCDSTQTTDSNGDGLADDRMIMIPAVGAEGGPPLPGFLEGVFGP
jgi:hypothetical protein